MCGRLNVIDDPLCGWVRDQLGISFHTVTNCDLRPTQMVSTIGMTSNGLYQIDCSWGIKPEWSKQLLINAKAETVREKKTFASAFKHHRVLVPCSGWYEWHQEEGHKQKYAFGLPSGEPVLMAGILFPSERGQQLVTLTTAPTEQAAQYHSRMPLLVSPNDVDFWFNFAPEALDPLLHAPELNLQIDAV
ncbi:SOS response-associated peptidase [Shewanella sp. C32]|uniref:Abasic site processing protein n=1 Tax=Shewanella electrica TaxID=515560 RepID=A0ABT2FPW9_9GAMM|nr:SOS response-associated peptidase family protein [Shewanella electrica]MCH1926806.1 SOS response-associated peptidase [Shewanella electrica]MCS4558367.1 SOS response-associated peptidase [Shewanella electrica]